MQRDDRTEFDRQISILCAGFNVPLGDRAEAYWRAFERLSLVEFARMVDAALADGEGDRIPTVRQLWAIRRKLRTHPDAGAGPGQSQVDLVAAAIERFKPTEAQLAMPWSWVTRNPAGQDCAILGVIIPQDPKDPERYPGGRMMFSEMAQ